MNKTDPKSVLGSSEEEAATPPRTRTTPSGAVDWAWELLKQKHFRLKTGVDIGCGKGRNTLFLARKGVNMTAMDLAPDAIAAVQEAAAKQKLSDKIRAFVQDVTEDWPIATHSADLIIDTFYFRHLASPAECHAYKQNLLRVLNERGHYLVSFSSIGDGYYGGYTRRVDQKPMPVDKAVNIDRVHGVESAIYTRDKTIKFMLPELSLYDELRSCDRVPKTKDDGTYALLFRRSEKWFYT